MKIPSFVHDETPFRRLCGVPQAKIGNYFEPTIPRNRNEANGGEISFTKLLPVQSNRGHPAERGKISRILRLHELFGIEDIIGRRGNSISPQRPNTIKETYGCQQPES